MNKYNQSTDEIYTLFETLKRRIRKKNTHRAFNILEELAND